MCAAGSRNRQIPRVQANQLRAACQHVIVRITYLKERVARQCIVVVLVVVRPLVRLMFYVATMAGLGRALLMVKHPW